MNEKDIMKGTLKLHVFDTFPFDELAEIVKLIESRGYTSTMVDNGNIVLSRNKIELNQTVPRKILDVKSSENLRGGRCNGCGVWFTLADDEEYNKCKCGHTNYITEVDKE